MPKLKYNQKTGEFKLNKCYKEILRLANMLEEAGIPFEQIRNMDGWQICYPVSRPLEERLCSVIEHYGSYGGLADRLEIMGLLTPEEGENEAVLGWLTAEEVFERIKQRHFAHENLF